MRHPTLGVSDGEQHRLANSESKREGTQKVMECSHAPTKAGGKKMTPPEHDDYWKLYAGLLELRTKGLRNRLQRYRQGTDRISSRAYKQLREILSGKTIPATALLDVTLDDFLDERDELDFNALLWWIDQEAR